MKLSVLLRLSLALFVAASGIFSSLATAQQSSRLPSAFTRLFEQEMGFQSRYAPEQIHLFTDRDVYAAGDTIWFSGWVLNDQTLEPTTHSQRLYVDLINPNLKVVQDLVLEIKRGIANGSFVLSENQKSEVFFQLRAYTQWSMHFDSTYRYHRILPVWQKMSDDEKTIVRRNPKYRRVLVGKRMLWRKIRPEEEGEAADSLADKSLPFIDVAFLPEGGSWVENIPCRMAFKALATDGYGVEIEGEILDQNDSLICPFQSEHLGMGSFLITPRPGKSYQARLFTGQRIELPQPEKSGATLKAEIEPDGSGLLTVTVSLSPGEVDPGREVILVVQSIGEKATAYPVQRNRTVLPLKIPNAKLPEGITRLTLYNEKAEPLAERLCFLPLVRRRLSVDMEPFIARVDTPADLSGARLTLKLQSKELQTDFPIPALLAISVTDSLTSLSDSSSASLVSRMLLQGLLKGEVEDPQYYFSHPYDSVAGALDLVMLTHGWRGYLRRVQPEENEKRTRGGKSPTESEFPPQDEKGFSVSGRITDVLNKPIPNLKVWLQVQADSMHAEETLSNKMGRFAFTNLPLWGASKLTIWAENKRSQRRWFNVGFKLDPQNEILKPPVYRPNLPEQSFGVMALLETFRKNKLLEQAFLDSLRNIPGMIYIDEVAITAKPYIKNSYNRNGPGNADYVLDEKALGKFDRFSTVLEVLEHEIPGFRIVYINLEMSSASPMPKPGYDCPRFTLNNGNFEFLIDGAPLPYYGATPSTLQGIKDRYQFYYDLIRSIPVSELVGVEVMISPQYTAVYGRKIIEITTKSGYGLTRGLTNGTVITYLRGFSAPRQFYQPKYIPREFPDRLTYHQKPTLLWVPELITSEEGKAEVSLPVGRNFARTLRVRIESYSPTGVVGSDEVYLPVGREKGTW